MKNYGFEFWKKTMLISVLVTACIFYHTWYSGISFPGPDPNMNPPPWSHIMTGRFSSESIWSVSGTKIFKKRQSSLLSSFPNPFGQFDLYSVAS